MDASVNWLEENCENTNTISYISEMGLREMRNSETEVYWGLLRNLQTVFFDPIDVS